MFEISFERLRVWYLHTQGWIKIRFLELIIELRDRVSIKMSIRD